MNHIQLLPPKVPCPFLQSCCQLTPACTGERGYSFQGTGFAFYLVELHDFPISLLPQTSDEALPYDL